VKRLLISFNFVQEFKSQLEKEYYYLAKRLHRAPSPGIVTFNGWKLKYINPDALLVAIQSLILKRQNDFLYDGDDPVILDCGANIGISILNYKRQFPNARIIAFEPDPEVCKVLRENLELNSVQDVEVVEAAVWTEESTLEFYQHYTTDGSRLVLDEDYVPKVSEDKLFVKTVRLVDYLRELTVDFIKMDIEGAESAVIADSVPYLKKVPQMVIEYHHMMSSAEAFSSILKHLTVAEFDITVNQYGQRIDLLHRDRAKNNLSYGYDQLFLVCAWHPS
jgi:FkbM family methyltransferase